MTKPVIVIAARPTFAWLARGAVLLTALSASFWAVRLAFNNRLHGIGRLFDVDHELSLPNWWSILWIAAMALLLALIASILRARGERRDLAAWTTLAAGFTLMSIEELVGFHERLSEFLHAHWPTQGPLAYGWVLFAIPLVAVIGLRLRGFLARLEPRRRRQFLVAGAVYLGGTVVMEMIGGKVLGEQDAPVTAAYALCFHIEEFMEMLGVALFLRALIEHLAGLLGADGLTVRFTTEDPS